ncbi:hypothetical protein P3X46_001816 [Hevea brasiliensis]|uniref:CHCH domain-containing protein n=1 Tax=Hevea brasiliensis TaxID=3981 RepID=A0ABQ9NFJ0_HEVBR|nr:mitochondrial intermembrane space import and assembly protein 40 homolog [Hevea brasiliensis]KAJ9190635.1 hypothetical protein P3X46_001816 [Hevea brasiliensis]
MGQAQSEVASTPEPEVDQTQSQLSSSVTPHNSRPDTPMESLIAEAVAYGNNENESLDAKAQRALECPCIADLRNGPCGIQFSDAFLCFLKSTAEEKGSDCVHPFVALQNCIKAKPDAFSKDILEEEVKKEEKPAQEYRIIPPKWSRESPSPKL